MSAIELLYQSVFAFPHERILVINAHAHALLTTISEQAEQLDLQQHFKSEYTTISKNGLTVHPDWPAGDIEYDVILLLPGKNKQQTLAWLAEATNRLRQNGKVVVACANKHGAKSYETALKQIAENISSRCKSKCRIFSTRRSAIFNNHLAKQWIDTGKPRCIDAHGLISQPGLFSWNRPDPGSVLLMGKLPELSGTGMDLCCGYGFLAAHILRQSTNIKCLHLVEADRFALDCARQNTTSWPGLTQFHWTDATTELLPDRLDWIVCNPPFHSGQNRDVELGQSIVLRACKSLRRDGILYLVANRKLPYERLLQTALTQYRTLLDVDGFKIIEGIR